MPKLLKSLSLFTGLVTAQLVPFDQPLPVLTSPVAQVKAGHDLYYQLFNSRNATCQGTLTFQNDTFLPISALARPKNCAGDQIAKFRIPESAPNGAAALEWKCANVEGVAVDIMVISGGSGEPDTLSRESELACVETLCHQNKTRGHDEQHNGTCD